MNLPQLLSSLAVKLMEISDNCSDVETQSELNELVDKIMESV